MAELPSKIVDRRTRKFSMVEHAIIDVWAPKIGVYGIGVYVALCRFAGSEGSCFPSQGRIAELLKISRRQVGLSLSTLRDSKLIDWEERKRTDGGKSSNTYYLLDVPEADPQDSGGVCASGAQGVAHGLRQGMRTTDTGVCASGAHLEEDTVTNDTQFGSLCSLDLSSLKEENDLENSTTLIRRLAAAEPSLVFRALTALAAVDRMQSVAPGKKLDSRVAAFRWFLKNPKSITQGDEDVAYRVVRDFDRETNPDVAAVLEGLTCLTYSDSEIHPSQSQQKRALDLFSLSSETNGQPGDNSRDRRKRATKRSNATGK